MEISVKERLIGASLRQVQSPGANAGATVR